MKSIFNKDLSHEKTNHFIPDVNISLLQINDFNPRKHLDQQHIEKLSEVIHQNGFDDTCALKCYEEDGLYKIFAGGNRLAACKKL